MPNRICLKRAAKCYDMLKEIELYLANPAFEFLNYEMPLLCQKNVSLAVELSRLP